MRGELPTLPTSRGSGVGEATSCHSADPAWSGSETPGAGVGRVCVRLSVGRVVYTIESTVRRANPTCSCRHEAPNQSRGEGPRVQ